MRTINTMFPDVYMFETLRNTDKRGYFEECFKKECLSEAGLEYDFIQDNHSYTREAGTVRGIHYQLSPKAQAKLVRVISGAIYDVVVDLRRKSPTFGRWIGVIISEFNKRQILVPQGFGHAFCTMTRHTHVIYKVNQYFDPYLDRGIRWDDFHLNIDWPVTDPILSVKDRGLPLINEAELYD